MKVELWKRQQKAISSPLLEDVTIKGATGVLINICGGPSMTLHEISEASRIIQAEAHDDANILFGAVIDETMNESMRVTVVATGFGKGSMARASATRNQIAMKTPARSQQQPMAHAAAPAPQAGQSGEIGESLYPQGSANYDGLVSEPRVISQVPALSDGEGLSLAAQNYPGDEYDIPTFLRKQADLI